MYNSFKDWSYDFLMVQAVFQLFIIAYFKSSSFRNCVNTRLSNFVDFLIFVSENNPLIIDYSDAIDDKEIVDNTVSIDNSISVDNAVLVNKKVEQKYEDKYLEKFKKFPNEFSFNELELEKEEYEKIKIEFEKNRADKINEIEENLNEIKSILTQGGFEKNNDNGNYTDNINNFGINKLLHYFDLEDEYSDDPDDIDFEDLYVRLMEIKKGFDEQMTEAEKMEMTEEEMRKDARSRTIDKKLNKYIDNYVLEHTPLGNIYMRYNNDKKSFEYFSNNSIPYRYLEPVGRKYVMTYWCKPIFVDIEEELKRAEERYDEEKKKKDEEAKKLEEEKQNNPKKFLAMAKFKSYNKDTKDTTIRPMKNRTNNSVLPPQIQANLPDVNKTSEKQLLKENANRYTWEGRLTNFCPLKKIDRKVVDKKLAMTYADFKKLQQEQQNKK